MRTFSVNLTTQCFPKCAKKNLFEETRATVPDSAKKATKFGNNALRMCLKYSIYKRRMDVPANAPYNCFKNLKKYVRKQLCEVYAKSCGKVSISR